MKENTETFNHNVNIIDRKNIVITGVKKIHSFNEKEFYIDSVMGQIIINGSSLELLKLDTYQGTISIKGLISGLIYLDGNKKDKQSFTSRLFK